MERKKKDLKNTINTRSETKKISSLQNQIKFGNWNSRFLITAFAGNWEIHHPKYIYIQFSTFYLVWYRYREPVHFKPITTRKRYLLVFHFVYHCFSLFSLWLWVLRLESWVKWHFRIFMVFESVGSRRWICCLEVYRLPTSDNKFNWW